MLLTRRQWLWTGFAAAAASFGLLGLWSRREADALVVEKLRLPLRNLAAPVRLAQLTDLHWDGQTVRWEMLESAVAAVNAWEPDLVALTGDYVTSVPEPIHELAPLLGTLQARHGTWAVLGNHDNVESHSHRTIRRALRRARIGFLENRWTEVAGIALGGTGDLWLGPFDPDSALAPAHKRLPTVLLSHNPDGFWRLTDRRIDLQISGHTHGGQVRLPGLGPLLPWNYRLHGQLGQWWPELAEMWPYQGVITRTNSWQGLFASGDNQLYVSRGLGRFRRLSIGCPPEVTLIELVPA